MKAKPTEENAPPKSRTLTKDQQVWARGLNELVKFAQGKPAKGIHVMPLHGALTPDDVRAFRRRMKFSQSQFAAAICVKPETVKKWEQGGNPVSGPAAQWIRAAQRRPEMVEELLGILLDPTLA